jgi:CoA:oxalate CoA-transferase
MTQRPRQQTRPLDGLRVLDLSRAVSGPFAGRILADLGADVVRAELPGTDVTQAFGKVIRGRSGLYSHVNAGKRSIVLDLHQPGDLTRLLDLAAACDVVVENFRPGVLDRFGAGWPALSAVNPRLVMLSISGFGREGEDAERAAYAPVIHAEAGLIGRQADITGDPPADIAFALADALAGLHGTIAILAALRLRDRTGTGQHIDLSMLEAMLATDDYTHYSIDEHPVRPARGEVWPAPGGPILVSADRKYLWHQLKTCFGVTDPDPDAPLEDKLRARARVMAAWFAAHQDRDALKRDLETARLAWADIRHAEDVLAAPSVAGRGIIVEVTDGDGEKRSVVRMPYRFSAAASGPVRGVPEPGEHTDDILRDWTRHGQLPGHPACPAPGVTSAARGAEAQSGMPPATATMWHCCGYDRHDVTSLRLRRQAK